MRVGSAKHDVLENRAESETSLEVKLMSALNGQTVGAQETELQLDANHYAEHYKDQLAYIQGGTSVDGGASTPAAQGARPATAGEPVALARWNGRDESR